MSEEQLKAFLEKVKADTSLQEKLKAGANQDAVLAIAKEAGFMVSVEDLQKAVAEISEDELSEVNGGVFWFGRDSASDFFKEIGNNFKQFGDQTLENLHDNHW